MRKPQLTAFSFPLKGVHEGFAAWQQPKFTTIDCLNVLAYDVTTGRARGGQRPGLAKFVGTQINSSNRVQDINHVTYASSASSGSSEVAVRAIKAVAVAGGTIKTFDSSSVSSVTSGSAALSSTAPVIFSTQFFGKIHFVDGTNYKHYTPGTNTAATWTAAEGTLPANSSDTCRLIESWGGRLVMSGIKSDPQNWFMCRLGDADDWDYGADPEETIAVAGNNSPAGYLGDIVNGMVPYNDDILIFGGDHTLWKMTGNPVAGGRIDLLTDITGMAWGRAWCKDPAGVVYFMGSRGGIYRLAGNTPEKINVGPINERLQRVEHQTHIVRMAYDDNLVGIHIWITSFAGGLTTHYFYDLRQEGWFPFQYDNTDHNPVAVHVFDGDEPDDRRILLGSGDGYIRTISPATKSDDGTAINSYVLFGPVQAVDEGGTALPFILSELQAVLTDGSSDVDYAVFVGDSAEQALAAVANRGGLLLLEGGDALLLEDGSGLELETELIDAQGTLRAIRSMAVNPRRRAYAAFVSLGTNNATSRWAMESLQVKASVITSSRRRK